MNKQLLSVIKQILENNTENFNNHEVFGMVSLITLNQIINIYQNINIATEEQSFNSLINKISQQNNNNSGNIDLEKLLPVIMSLLGNKNNLGNLLNSLNPPRDTNQQNEKTEHENINHEQEKKNNKYVKKN